MPIKSKKNIHSFRTIYLSNLSENVDTVLIINVCFYYTSVGHQ